jgi:hypothetical protein
VIRDILGAVATKTPALWVSRIAGNVLSSSKTWEDGMAVETQDRWTEIRGIHKQYRTLYEVLGGFTGIALLVFIGFTIFAQDQPGFAANVYTETISAIASIIVTVLILDRRAEQREEKRRNKELYEHLVTIPSPKFKMVEKWRF